MTTKRIIMKDTVNTSIYAMVDNDTDSEELNKKIAKHKLQFARNPNFDWPYILMHKDSKYIPINNILIASDVEEVKFGAMKIDDAVTAIENGKISVDRLYRET